MPLYDGFVAKFMGDGVLAYFGYPPAHEDDPERAVRAGLDIVAAVGRIKTRSGVKLQVRIGIATGLVVVGDLIGEGASQEQAVVGDTPNLAARLQRLAEPGAVVISGSTRQLTGTYCVRAAGGRMFKDGGNALRCRRWAKWTAAGLAGCTAVGLAGGWGRIGWVGRGRTGGMARDGTRRMDRGGLRVPNPGLRPPAGAAIGREFSHGLLGSVVRKPEPELEMALDRLMTAGLLFRQGVPPHATYLFKHALVQDAAYGLRRDTLR